MCVDVARYTLHMKPMAAVAPPPAAAAPAASSALFSHLSDFSALFLLCFVGGYVDAAGYLGLFGIFTGSITGNLVLAGSTVVSSAGPAVVGDAGSSVVRSAGGVVPRVVVTAVFAGGSALGGALAAGLRAHLPALPRRGVFLWLLALELASLGAFWLAGTLLADSLTSIAAPNVTFVGAMAALAMGVQSCAVKDGMPGAPSTTVMTTTLAVIGALLGEAGYAAAAAAGLARTPVAAEARSAAARAKGAAFVRSTMPVVAFVLGACLGAALQYFIGFHSTCVPVALVGLVMACLALPLPAAAAPPAAAA